MTHKAPAAQSTDPRRSSDLAKIHIALSQLPVPMNRDDYTALLRTEFGVESSSQLDAVGRAKLLAHFEKLGWKPSAKATARKPGSSRDQGVGNTVVASTQKNGSKPVLKHRPTPSWDAAPMVRRIRAQLISLGRLPDTYADGIAKQILGDQAPEFYEWCSTMTLYTITQALGVEQKRKGVPTR